MTLNPLLGLQLDLEFKKCNSQSYFWLAYLGGLSSAVPSTKKIVLEHIISAQNTLLESCYWMARAGLNFFIFMFLFLSLAGVLDLANSSNDKQRKVLAKIAVDRGILLLLAIGIDLILLFSNELFSLYS